MACRAEHIRQLQIVAHSWLMRVVRSKYTDAFVNDIDQLSYDATILLSELERDAGEEGPEDTAIGNVDAKYEKLNNEFAKLKEVMDSYDRPKKTLKRSASDHPDESMPKYPAQSAASASHDANEAEEGVDNASQIVGAADGDQDDDDSVVAVEDSQQM
eukprot:4128190-Pyramimonas_sp.AAC.1